MYTRDGIALSICTDDMMTGNNAMKWYSVCSGCSVESKMKNDLQTVDIVYGVRKKALNFLKIIIPKPKLTNAFHRQCSWLSDIYFA